MDEFGEDAPRCAFSREGWEEEASRGGGKLGKVSYPRDTAKSCNDASIHEGTLSACCRRWERARFSPEKKGAEQGLE